MPLTKRFLLGSLLVAAITPALFSQVTLYEETFEGVTPSALPAGWTNGSSFAISAANPSATGVNTSSQVLTWTQEAGGVADNTPAIDLTNYTSGYTFTLSFDLYANSTNDHSLLIGYGDFALNAPDAWIISDSTAAYGTLRTDLTATNTWQHFSFDITSAATTYFGTAADVSDFRIFFEEWSSSAAHVLTSIDNLKLVATATAVPEPGTYALFAGLTVWGLIAFRRRRI